MRIFLFGLSPRCINHMDLAVEFIPLVLPISTYNTFCWWFITRLDDYDLTWFYLYLLFSACLFDLSTGPTVTPDTMLFVHVTRFYFTYSLGCFSDNLWNCTSRFLSLEQGGSLCSSPGLFGRHGALQYFSPVQILDRLWDFPFAAREQLFTLFVPLVNSYFICVHIITWIW